MITEQESGETLLSQLDLSSPDLNDDLIELVEENDCLNNLLHGQCHLVAVALHRATGWPIAGYIDADPNDERRAYLLHAFVLDADPDHIVDICGRRTIDSMLTQFDYLDPDIPDLPPLRLSENEVIQWGQGTSHLIPETKAELARIKKLIPALLKIVDAQQTAATTQTSSRTQSGQQHDANTH